MTWLIYWLRDRYVAMRVQVIATLLRIPNDSLFKRESDDGR
jgi:hypothetical protein